MEWILNNKHYSKEVKISVLVVVIGVGVCTVTDVKVNAKGFICASVAVFATSLQQIVCSLIFMTLVNHTRMVPFLTHTNWFEIEV